MQPLHGIRTWGNRFPQGSGVTVRNECISRRWGIANHERGDCDQPDGLHVLRLNARHVSCRTVRLKVVLLDNVIVAKTVMIQHGIEPQWRFWRLIGEKQSYKRLDEAYFLHIIELRTQMWWVRSDRRVAWKLLKTWPLFKEDARLQLIWCCCGDGSF